VGQFWLVILNNRSLRGEEPGRAAAHSQPGP